VTARALGLACAAALGLALAGGVAASSPPADAPGRATSDEATAIARVAEKRFDEWRFGEGRAAVADLVRLAPGAPETLYLEGYQRFLEGDYAGSVQKLDGALLAGPRGAGVVNAKELRALASEARDAVKDHKEERFGHFLVRYPAVDAVLVPYAREALEAAYRALHDDLGFEAELPIRIEIYRSPSDLAAVSSLTVAEVSRTGTIALCKWARLMVTSPRALATGYPWLDTINHELVHYAVSSLTHDRAPVWLQEGLAKFLERRWREAPGGRIPPAMEHMLAKALRSGKLISFEAMHPSMAKLPSAEDATLAFAEVANAVAHLFADKGTAGLRDAVKRVGDGEDARDAVAAAAGVTWPEFERGWRAYMAAQKYKTFPAIDFPTTHIRKAGAIASQRKPSEDEALAPAAKPSAASTAAFRYLRLGNMLLRRDRPRAAVTEYEKGAKAVTSAGHAGGDAAAAWLFPVKLGRTYLVLGEPDRALKALEPVAAVYPDLPWPHLIAGEAKLAKGAVTDAIVELRAALATNPFDPEVHCSLADAYEKSPADAAPGGSARGDLVALERRFCKELGSTSP
jgi:tetratricopeptide (TPR) repeat protein